MRVTTQQITFCSDSVSLDDKNMLSKIIDTMTAKIGLTKVGEIIHAFEPQGFSLVYILAESHIALHSWPEEQYAYITVSSCSDMLLDEESCSSIIEQIMPISNLKIDTINREI